MELLDKLMRWWSPRRYCRRMVARTRRQHTAKIKAARLATGDRSRLEKEIEDLRWCLREWQDWLTQMEEYELVIKAKKMAIFLEDIPPPPPDSNDPEQDMTGHYQMGMFGNELLRRESHLALTKLMRERMSSYRKEQREIWDLCIKAVAVLIGLLGAASGFVAVLKK